MSRSYLTQAIGSIADRNFSFIEEDSTVAEAARKMRDKDSTSILVAKKGSADPIGIVTERYLVPCLSTGQRSLQYFIKRRHELPAYLY
jgi:CBS domain-containing protein